MTRDPEYVDGVDVSLIRSSLALTPYERVQRLQELIEFFTEVRKRNGIEPVDFHSPDAGERWG
ncbi:MAG TPA: hypothetical protein VKX45_09285 [Bryobacteraceae bacterium]|jgi:hypothetical protein|nr:hypothetical protein [Bryobacteraceae bacterium]